MEGRPEVRQKLIQRKGFRIGKASKEGILRSPGGEYPGASEHLARRVVAPTGADGAAWFVFGLSEVGRG